MVVASILVLSIDMLVSIVETYGAEVTLGGRFALHFFHIFPYFLGLGSVFLVMDAKEEAQATAEGA